MSTYEVRLDVFEGPFQLLLSLITEQRVDVCDVPIAQLTNDYLAHLERMESSELDVTTEFMIVAATLLALKARALLPKPSTPEAEEEELERDLLIARLLEVRTFQAAGDHLSAHLASGDRRFGPRPAPDDEATRRLPSLADIRPDDLARALIEMARYLMRAVDTSKVVVDQVSTDEAAAELVRHLRQGPIRFRSVSSGRSVSWCVALFLAMLELSMRGEIDLGEGTTVGDIELRLPEAS